MRVKIETALQSLLPTGCQGICLSGQRNQPLNRFFVGAEFIRLLPQKSMNCGQIFDGVVEDRVGAFLIGADANQIFGPAYRPPSSGASHWPWPNAFLKPCWSSNG